MNIKTEIKQNKRILGAGNWSQRARLASGLILMAFATTHFLNHAFGNISLEAMEAMRTWRVFFWQSPPGATLLYGALIAHVVLTLGKLIARRTFRLKIWEWTQIGFGLVIPYFLLTHIIAMRGTVQILPIEVDYPLALAMMWPGAAWSQSALLLFVWVHGCIGIHFWLRLKPWYLSTFPILLSFCVALPILGLTGWIEAARTNAENLAFLKNADPQQFQEVRATISEIYSHILPIIDTGKLVVAMLAIFLLILIAINLLLKTRRKRVEVQYGGDRKVSAVHGSTILDVSRNNGISHMSVCGGRARCSTCRTLIVEGEENLSKIEQAEQKLLSRLNVESSVRLACRAKVHGDISIRPLIQLESETIALETTDPIGWGIEREIVVMFLDIRGFSKISEQSLPYDIIFILNSFFSEVSKAVEKRNGYVDKFMGDGMMALFGIEEELGTAADNALVAARDCIAAADKVSRMLTQHLSTPIRIGVGLHAGEAVVGRIGRTADQTSPSRLTAIGDSVNVAARLEQATKELKSVLVISKQVRDAASIFQSDGDANASTISVHNISRPVDILSFAELAQINSAIAK